MKVRSVEGGGVLFWCPGCEEPHHVRVTSENPGPVWGFNGSETAPTFTPSVLLRSGHYVTGQTRDTCWCSYHERTGEHAPFKCDICHSFVTDGRIQFLSDSTHKLAGQTVDLPAWPHGRDPA